MNCLTVGLLALTACLADPDPAIRDRIAFERFSSAMRGGAVDRATLTDVKGRLLAMLTEPDPQGVARPFVILTLSEVARTDRLNAWMTDSEREQLVAVAADYLSGITDYRAFTEKEGFRHGVAHGADLAMQLALNSRTRKPQLDRLLTALASQVAPKDPAVAYWAGEPDRLARAVLIVAQRNVHSDADWKTWFAALMDPKPLASWDVAFNSEAGIRKHHNVRTFLLSLLASVSTTSDAGMQKLLNPVRDSLRLVP